MGFFNKISLENSIKNYEYNLNKTKLQVIEEQITTSLPEN